MNPFLEKGLTLRVVRTTLDYHMAWSALYPWAERLEVLQKSKHTIHELLRPPPCDGTVQAACCTGAPSLQWPG